MSARVKIQIQDRPVSRSSWMVICEEPHNFQSWPCPPLLLQGLVAPSSYFPKCIYFPNISWVEPCKSKATLCSVLLGCGRLPSNHVLQPLTMLSSELPL